jgi:hypothetical protein
MTYNQREISIIDSIDRYILSHILLYIENDAEIFPVHYIWKVAEKGFKMVSIMNKLAIINSCEIILEK